MVFVWGVEPCARDHALTEACGVGPEVARRMKARFPDPKLFMFGPVASAT